MKKQRNKPTPEEVNQMRVRAIGYYGRYSRLYNECKIDDAGRFLAAAEETLDALAFNRYEFARELLEQLANMVEWCPMVIDPVSE